MARHFLYNQPPVLDTTYGFVGHRLFTSPLQPALRAADSQRAGSPGAKSDRLLEVFPKMKRRRIKHRQVRSNPCLQGPTTTMPVVALLLTNFPNMKRRFIKHLHSRQKLVRQSKTGFLAQNRDGTGRLLQVVRTPSRMAIVWGELGEQELWCKLQITTKMVQT